MEYEVAAVPTCIFYRAGQILDRVEGAKAADVSKLVRNLVSQKITMPHSMSNETSDQKSIEPIEKKLKRLINAAPCMLFMKVSNLGNWTTSLLEHNKIVKLKYHLVLQQSIISNFREMQQLQNADLVDKQ